MAEPEVGQPTREGHPVAVGLLALVSVAVVIGLVLGGAAMIGTRALGLGDGQSISGGSTSEESMFLPTPEPTDPDEDPLVTLAPQPTPTKSEVEEQPTKKPATPITLTVGQTEVVPMGQIDLSGVYPGGEGSILQVQQFSNGGWDDFPVTASVSNETFRTFVQTGQPGVNRFRMVDSDSGLTSNEIKVTISGG